MSEWSRRNHEIAIARRITTSYRESEESDMSWWHPRDSALDSGEYSFQSWFQEVLPQGETLKSYIEKILAGDSPRLGIEVGGPGSRLFAGFDEGFFDATAGLTLTDQRKGMFAYLKKQDEARNHTVIPGSVLDESAESDVINWQKGRPLGVVIERMYAGARSLPREPFFMSKRTNFWYQRGKLLLAEVPQTFEPQLEDWKALVEQNYKGKLEVKIGNSPKNSKVVRILKLAEAPFNLPLLDARTVIRNERMDRRRQGL